MPFGACLVKEGRVLASVHNAARKTLDTTAQTEMQAIREASQRLRALELPGCVLYATCEPCPMCFSACEWSRVSRIVYGRRIQDAEKMGIRQIPILSNQMKQFSRSAIELFGDVLREESLELFKAWVKSSGRP
ncbi:MAG: nucleoside deaminase [Nitrospiraceae bacterium]